MSPKNGAIERAQMREQIIFRDKIIWVLAASLIVTLVGFIANILSEKTIIAPPVVSRQYEIGSNYANKSYLVDMASYAVDLLKTTTPGKVDVNNKAFLKLVDPEDEPRIKTVLDAAAIRVKRDRIVTLWELRGDEVSLRDKSVILTGKLKTYIADKLVSEHQKSYEVNYRVSFSGTLYVKDVKEVIDGGHDANASARG